MFRALLGAPAAWARCPPSVLGPRLAISAAPVLNCIGAGWNDFDDGSACPALGAEKSRPRPIRLEKPSEIGVWAGNLKDP